VAGRVLESIVTFFRDGSLQEWTLAFYAPNNAAASGYRLGRGAAAISLMAKFGVCGLQARSTIRGQ
jgi:hypothetical protein